MNVRKSRILIAALVLAAALLLPGCKKDEKQTDTGTGPTGPNVVFVRWSSFGHSGAFGYVRNDGTGTARDVKVKTKGANGGPYLESSVSPVDLAPGAQGSFDGAACGQDIPGQASAPSVIWIHWD